MSDKRVTIYAPDGRQVGFFLNPDIQVFPEGDYELSGVFFDSEGERLDKVDFNPQALPYTADLSQVEGMPHATLQNVYVQRGRQPVCMSGSAVIPN